MPTKTERSDIAAEKRFARMGRYVCECCGHKRDTHTCKANAARCLEDGCKCANFVNEKWSANF
jgi:hypothetical protein